MLTARLSDRLAGVSVGDLMHAGVVRCMSDETLGQVATRMAAHRVHAIAVVRPGRLRPTGFIADADLLGALAAGVPFTGHDACTAATIATAEPYSGESAVRAAQLMHEHATTHVLVVDHAGGYPVGILSSVDLLAAVAGLAAATARPGSSTPPLNTRKEQVS